MPCRTSCPQNAFEELLYSPDEYNGLEELPGREGCYSLELCDRQMKIDEENEDNSGVSIPNYGVANSVIKYCRECELNCLAVLK
jgi:epoxyqueuosine reductase